MKKLVASIYLLGEGVVSFFLLNSLLIRDIEYVSAMNIAELILHLFGFLGVLVVDIFDIRTLKAPVAIIILLLIID